MQEQAPFYMSDLIQPHTSCGSLRSSGQRLSVVSPKPILNPEGIDLFPSSCTLTLDVLSYPALTLLMFFFFLQKCTGFFSVYFIFLFYSNLFLLLLCMNVMVWKLFLCFSCEACCDFMSIRCYINLLLFQENWYFLLNMYKH